MAAPFLPLVAQCAGDVVKIIEPRRRAQEAHAAARHGACEPLRSLAAGLLAGGVRSTRRPTARMVPGRQRLARPLDERAHQAARAPTTSAPDNVVSTPSPTTSSPGPSSNRTTPARPMKRRGPGSTRRVNNHVAASRLSRMLQETPPSRQCVYLSIGVSCTPRARSVSGSVTAATTANSFQCQRRRGPRGASMARTRRR